MRERLATLGLIESGAYNFYRTRLESGRVFLNYEIRLLEEFGQGRLPIGAIDEIGCGWGQFVFLLAWNGYTVRGFEKNRDRYEGARDFKRVLRRIDAARTNRATIRCQSFPPRMWLKTKDALALGTNLVGGWTARTESKVLAGLRRYRYVLLDIDRFGIKRSAGERPALVARLEEAGLTSLGLFCDLGEDGHYHLFEPRPRQRRLPRQGVAAEGDDRHLGAGAAVAAGAGATESSPPSD